MKISLRMESCWVFSGANQGTLSWKCCDTLPLGPILAWRMNLRQVFTEIVDCTRTEVGHNKKLQIENRREVKAQLRRGERWERKIRFSFWESGEWSMYNSSSPPEEKNESPSPSNNQSRLATWPFSENKCGLGSGWTIQYVIAWYISIMTMCKNYTSKTYSKNLKSKFM